MLRYLRRYAIDDCRFRRRPLMTLDFRRLR